MYIGGTIQILQTQYIGFVPGQSRIAVIQLIRQAAWLGTGTTVPASPADEAAHKALSGVADT